MSDVLNEWFDDGCPVTEAGIPQEAKAYLLRVLAEDNGLRTLVETGTGFGDMTSRMVDDFDAIYSVELHPEFYAHCVERFKDNDNVWLTHGDSGEFIEELVRDIIHEPTLWFLDAHYAGPGSARGEVDTPIMVELAAILDHQSNHVVVVDDARLFGTEKDYPTQQQVYELAARHGYDMSLWGDEIVIK